MVIVALLSVDLVESVDLVSVYLVVNCIVMPIRNADSGKKKAASRHQFMMMGQLSSPSSNRNAKTQCCFRILEKQLYISSRF